MIDPQTGYNDEVVCGCKPCPDCDGEGGGTVYCADSHPGCEGHEWTCSTCEGTGKDASDCEISKHSEKPDPMPRLVELLETLKRLKA